MTTQAPVTTPVPVCPYLGLADDPATHLVFPSHSQRCHATTRPSTIETAKQAKDCLTEAHTGCSRYRPYAAPVPHGAVRAAIAAVTPDPGHPASPRPGVRTRARVVPLAILLVALAFAGIMLGAWLTSAMSDTPAGSGAPGPGASGTAASPPVASPTPPVTPTPPPTATPIPTPMPTPTATPIPTPTPSATPTPAPTPIVHRVRRGETLTGIAERYGVTIAAISKANGLPDPNLIVVGQLLVIPAR